jgi:hypothetical protein
VREQKDARPRVDALTAPTSNRFVIEAGKGLRMDPEKIKAIKEWEAPVNVKGVRSFLRFANFYWRFIKNYSGLTAPLTRLTGDVPFQ